MGLLVFAVVGSSVFQQQQIKQAKEKEQGVYLASLLDSTAASSDVDTDNSATPIETYFL